MPDPYEYQEFNLTTAMKIPQVRDRFERGVKLHELKELKNFFLTCSEREYLRKTYGSMMNDLEFLETSGAMKMPCATPGSHISSRRHWVAINGYYRVDPTTLLDEGIEVRKIINTLSLNTPILILDTEAWAMYRDIVRYSRQTLSSSLRYLVYAVSVLQQTGMPYGTYLNDRFIRWLLWMKDPHEIDEDLKRMCDEVSLDDKTGVLPLIMNGTYCVPVQNWIFSDGWYYQMAIPAWTLSSHGIADYTDNQVKDWDFFTVEV